MENFLYLHIAFVVVCGIVCWLVSKSVQQMIAVSIALFFFPIGGVLIFFSYYIYRYLLNSASQTQVEKELVIKEAYKFRSDIVVSDEMNVLPINDILTISDVQIKRERFLATIKKDISGYTRFITEALSNEDGETSHYAAAIIQETKRKMTVKAQALKAYYADNKNDLEVMKAYADFLNTYLSIDFFDEIARGQYVYEYLEVAKVLIKKRVLDEKYIIQLINILIELGDIDEALRYGDIYMVRYPESIDQYILNMKIRYSKKDIHGLSQLLSDLRSSDLVFDHETMNQVRFWIGE